MRFRTFAASVKRWKTSSVTRTLIMRLLTLSLFFLLDILATFVLRLTLSNIQQTNDHDNNPVNSMNTIHFESVLLDNVPTAFWAYKNNVGYETFESTRQQGLDLIAIANMAVVEARIINNLVEVRTLGESVAEINIAEIISFVRSGRNELPIGLNPIYGLKTSKGLIDCDWYGERIQFDYETALEHANGLLCLAEAIKTDSFLGSAFNDVGLIGEIRERIFHSFKKYRGQDAES